VSCRSFSILVLTHTGWLALGNPQDEAGDQQEAKSPSEVLHQLLLNTCDSCDEGRDFEYSFLQRKGNAWYKSLTDPDEEQTN
jgi:hypothetical protein